jgi:hypothetical protein
MLALRRYIQTALLSWLISVLTLQSAHAHLMVAQHGTLNIVDDGVFMVLSLPITAFEGIDTDNDGRVSMLEFNNHRGVIIDSVGQNIMLSDSDGSLPIEGIMLSPVVPHDDARESVSQLTVLAKFPLNDSVSALRFHLGLYGKQFSQQSLEMTATRASDKQKVVFELTPATPAREFFSGGARAQQKSVARIF